MNNNFQPDSQQPKPAAEAANPAPETAAPVPEPAAPASIPSASNRINWKRIIALIGGLVILVAIGYLALWLKSNPETNSANTLPPAVGTTEPADDLAGWQTYRNEEFGFEFKYPKTWSTYERKSNEVRLWIKGVSDVDAQIAIEAYRSSDLSSSELESLINSDKYNEPNKSIISNGGVIFLE